MSREKRTLTRPIEKREAGEAGSKVGGYAISYDSPTTIGEGDWAWEEVFAQGAFREAIKGDVLFIFGHDHNRVMGRTSSGTLRLSEDRDGVAYEADLPDTTDGRDLDVLVDRKDITGTSFGFRSVKEQWDETRSPPRRTILEAELFEISPTAWPAYDDTTIAKRNRESAAKERRSANFNAAASRLRMKAALDLRVRK